jgi:hypothetical protein
LYCNASESSRAARIFQERGQLCRATFFEPFGGQSFRNRFEDEDESGTTPTMATGLFNHKIQIYFDFVM